MNKAWKIAILSGALLAGIGGTASADPRVRFSVSIGAPAPVYAPYYPAPAYYPAYYPSQPIYTPPYVYYDRHPNWRRHVHRHHHHQRHNQHRHWR